MRLFSLCKMRLGFMKGGWCLRSVDMYTDTEYRKYKIPNYQNGHAYLTSHRVCYISAEEPRKYCIGIDLKEIDRAEYQVEAPDPCSMM